MNKFIKILESIGIAIITLLIMGTFIGLVSVILMPFVAILCAGIFMLADFLGEWVVLGIIICAVIIHFAREIYKNI